MHESWTMTPRTRRAKRMLLTSVGLTAGTLLFSCGRVEGEGPSSADGPFGTGGFVGNPKGCWYDSGGYGSCYEPPPGNTGGIGGAPLNNGEAGCAAGADPGGNAGFEGED